MIDTFTGLGRFIFDAPNPDEPEPKREKRKRESCSKGRGKMHPTQVGNENSQGCLRLENGEGKASTHGNFLSSIL